LALLASPALAQPGPDEPLRGRDRIQELLVPPDLIMRQQSKLNLTDDQEAAILKEIREAQSRFTELQWVLQREMDSLVDLVRVPNADEPKVIAQLDRALDAEREIKKARLVMGLRIRNVLTPEQLTTLERLRNRPGRTAPRSEPLPRPQ
jgi:Spy/CpxP family protein refolding chaperone